MLRESQEKSSGVMARNNYYATVVWIIFLHLLGCSLFKITLSLILDIFAGNPLLFLYLVIYFFASAIRACVKFCIIITSVHEPHLSLLLNMNCVFIGRRHAFLFLNFNYGLPQFCLTVFGSTQYWPVWSNYASH